MTTEDRSRYLGELTSDEVTQAVTDMCRRLSIPASLAPAAKARETP